MMGKYVKIMKRLLLIAFLVLSLYDVKAQEKISEYYSSYFDEVYDISATNDEGDLHLYIQVAGERQHDLVMFNITGVRKINEFSNALKLAKEKFVEWSSTAEENNVRNFDKDIDVVFPNITVCWYGLEWWFDFYVRLNPRFVVTESGKCVFVMSGTVTASSNEYIDQEYYFALSSKSDFDELIRNIEVGNLMDYFNKQENIDTLFK